MMSRQLALKLSCISSKDREWVLGRLSVSERGRMEVLLNEVKSLGLDRDSSVITSVLQSVRSKTTKNESILRISKIKNMKNLDVFWQTLLIASIEESQRPEVMKMFNIILDNDSKVEHVPPKLVSCLFDEASK